ncbi:PSD1 and planctomycete cytochrome C domain-containing protein [Ferruginibacter sp.]|uniref:PSD1 and planctomycete cytochrome C domain-containing protein n=1 Tax=Ferruginibacter sp. TaxID=1940288 RepID=UPI00265B0186|nr:PSD1 and planctomycete cytochrome C domain-containing protein [Ferruginibacter sp.]
MKSKMILVVALLLVTVTSWLACMNNSVTTAMAMPDKVSYNFHIRPVLSDKCFKCHGPDVNKREAGLRLDIPDSAFAPLKETIGAFALVPFKPEESELYKRISSVDTGYQMPTPSSHLGVLSAHEIALFKKWIIQGAKYEPHWAFVKPVKAPLPVIKEKGLAKNEIDYFVIAKQEQAGLTMNEETDKERLLKRLSLDLTGLPPTEKMMDDFMANKNVNTYETAVDTLLSRPAYGEKMAVQWLDIARYADSYGYQDDNVRTQWAWRDWVIHAFNKNIPYNTFLTWQIAGDMLPNATKEQVLATAFFRNHKYTEEGGVVPEEYRISYILDKTKTYSKGILGLTAECAQCHDHKYDPISQKEYYQLFAFFNNTTEVGYEGDVSQSKGAKHPILTISDSEARSMLTFINKRDTGSMMVSVMGERDTMRKTFVLNRGVYDQPTTEVLPSTIKAVMPFDTTTLPRNRLGLAAWTVNNNNPLTARVFVNHIWQEIFGRGLVKTSGDFGMQGELPTHPELIDWLAVDFMEHGWNVKRLMKQIVTSATYRQSGKVKDENYKKDPENIWLTRAPRMKVKAEFVRDIILASSGLLVNTIGGPSVKPYQTKGLWEMASSGRGELATYKQDKGEALYRRGMYTFIKLTVPPPSMILFDASNRDQCEVKRTQTNTPLQALMMMNDPTVLEASRVFAEALMEEKTATDEKIKKAFHRIICRSANTKEINILKSYFDDQLKQFQQKQLDATETLNVGEYPGDKKVDANTTAALMKTISMMYNMEEAIIKT